MPYSFNVLAKPNGPICNLDCTYCYYLDKVAYYPFTTNFVMNDSTLELYIAKYIAEQQVHEIVFSWQGGEPTLLGIDFFRKAVAFQKKYAGLKSIKNTFQTNGVLLTDEWCCFFNENKFLIGISIDGPEEVHDTYRLNKGGQGTFLKVLKGIDLLKRHNVEFNTLTVVNRTNASKPLEVYKFLKRIGSRYMQFIPIVEVDQHSNESEKTMAPWSVLPEQYGQFLIEIFRLRL